MEQAVFVGFAAAKAIKGRIKCDVAAIIGRMVVAPGGIGLPKLNQGV